MVSSCLLLILTHTNTQRRSGLVSFSAQPNKDSNLIFEAQQNEVLPVVNTGLENKSPPQSAGGTRLDVPWMSETLGRTEF